LSEALNLTKSMIFASASLKNLILLPGARFFQFNAP